MREELLIPAGRSRLFRRTLNEPQRYPTCGRNASRLVEVIHSDYPAGATIMNQQSTPNVHGWERAASIAGGLYFLGKGLGRGGLGGIVQLAVGGLALARGISGHCEAKRVLCELNEHTTMAEGTSRSMPLHRETDQQQLKDNAKAATETATVTGNDSLNNPPAGI